MSSDTIGNLSNEYLSRYWYCPTDKVKMAPRIDRSIQTPYFTVTKNNVATGIQNAASIRKIPFDAVEFGIEMATNIFSQDSSLQELPLLGVQCPKCNHGFAAPKIVHVSNLGKNIGKTLYDENAVLETKEYGRFRFVDRFGTGNNNNNTQNNTQSSMSRLFLLSWLFGLRVFILYYIVGLEMKFRNRWYPIGPVLVVVAVLILLLLAYDTGILGRLSYYI